MPMPIVFFPPRLQDDVVMGTLTVRENLNFSAALRLPASIPQGEKEQMVEKLIQELGLGRVAGSKVRRRRNGDREIRSVNKVKPYRKTLVIKSRDSPILIPILLRLLVCQYHSTKSSCVCVHVIILLNLCFHCSDTRSRKTC